MSRLQIIPSQNNLDIEVIEDFITLSQSADGNYESVVFHKTYADDVIRAILAAKEGTLEGESE